MRIGKVHKQISWRGEKKTPTEAQFNAQAAQTPAEGEPISISVKPNDFNCIILKKQLCYDNAGLSGVSLCHIFGGKMWF